MKSTDPFSAEAFPQNDDEVGEGLQSRRELFHTPSVIGSVRRHGTRLAKTKGVSAASIVITTVAKNTATDKPTRVPIEASVSGQMPQHAPLWLE